MSLKILLMLALSAVFLCPVPAPAFDIGEPCPPADFPRMAAKMDQVIGSFQLGEPTSIDMVVKNIIGVLSGIEFHIADEAGDKVGLRISDMKTRDILELVLLPAGYVWECSGESILVTRDPVASRRRELMLTLARADTAGSAGREDPLDRQLGEPLRIDQPVKLERFLEMLSHLYGTPSSPLNYAIHDGYDTEIKTVPEGMTIRQFLNQITADRNLAWEAWDNGIIITRDFRTRLFPLTPSEYEKVLVTLEGQPPSAPDDVKEIHFVVEGSTYTRRDNPAVVRKIVLDVLADTGGRE